MKVLLIDGQDSSRRELASILEKSDLLVIQAESPSDAYAIYEADSSIDIVLMEINGLHVDPIQATGQFRKTQGSRHVSIIFVADLGEADILEQCLAAGGDDFIPKPVHYKILLAKLNVHRRALSLYDKLSSANESLEYHKHMMEREHSIVEHVFSRRTDRVKTECDNVEKYTSPASMFDGDLVLVNPSPSGGVYVLIGDFTGHGLAASIGSLPVDEIFYGYTARQASISQIAVEINTRLYELLPTNMFFCATLMFMDHAGDNIMVWSGGMNDLHCLNPAGDTLHFIEGAHMPLGLLAPEEFDDRPTLLELEKGTQVFIFTDGVNEAMNVSCEEFGLERVHELMIRDGVDSIKTLSNAVYEFRQGAEQNDDISLVRIEVGPVVHRSRKTAELVNIDAELYGAKSFPWLFKMRLEGEDLKNTSIVNQVLDFVSSIQGIELHQDKIFTIVSELYSNALEHGVLGLESSLKESADGFEKYYKLRAQGLEDVSDHFIELDFSYIKGEPNCVKLVVTDSGKGFDYEALIKDFENNEEAHGRGVGLLESLCSHLEYSNQGRTVTAMYELRRHH